MSDLPEVAQVHSQIRVGELSVVEQIVELRPELQGSVLAQAPHLRSLNEGGVEIQLARIVLIPAGFCGALPPVRGCGDTVSLRHGTLPMEELT